MAAKTKTKSPPAPRRFERPNLLTSLVFVLPLLVFYEIGVLSSNRLNGADLITTTLLRLVGMRVFIWIQIGLIAAVVGIAVYLRRKQRFSIGHILPVLLESGIYALTMGTLIIFVMVDILGIDPRLAATGALKSASVFEKLVTSVGAGVHEELVFRLLMLGGLFGLLQRLKLIERSWLALIVALLISSALFSAAHHIGSLGDPLKVGVFTYRLIAGMIFGLLYHYRSFAIAVYTHTLYDIYVLLIG
ncbi:MAG: hypothetical protein CSA24_00300 [Deltaproteobacteria bacterium]|nr:MAG: hypothetical protein CSB49_03905 [Pseudomonadota bacterium]PIE66392.1 MAG: hypothetical protein CSA24_00300 [Deltaproteobacteria bacterium]